MDLSLLLKKILVEDIEGRMVPDEKEKPIEIKENKNSFEPIRPKRCQNYGCKTKLMLADFPCKCSNFYCSQHRFSESHKCTFNYKEQGVKLIEKNLVQVNGSKLNKL